MTLIRVSVLFMTAFACLMAAAQPARKAAPAHTQPACSARVEDSNFFRDEGLALKLSARLQFNKALLRERIEVKANAGVVSLSGNVTAPQHVALAGRIAAATEGVRCVNNYLKVGPPLESEANPGNSD